MRTAKAHEVRDRPGFPIGGVPPFFHGEGIVVLADASSTRFGRLREEAGTPSSTFGIGTPDLLSLRATNPSMLQVWVQEL